MPGLDSITHGGETLERTPVPVAIVEMPSMQLTPNPAFAGLLGLDDPGPSGAQPGLADLVVPEDWLMVESLFTAVASGMIDSCQGRGRLRRPSGDDLDVVGWVRPFDEERPRRRAVMAIAPADTTQPLPEPWLASIDVRDVTFGSLDHEWRFNEISPDATQAFGWDVDDHRGSPMQRAVHPDDAPRLLLTLARSGAERRAAATSLRVRGPGEAWTPVRCVLSPLCDHNPARFGFGLWPMSREAHLTTTGARAAELEGHLWRIGAEVQAARIGPVPGSDEPWWADPALRDLSERQSQILHRLVRGERAGGIARALFLSESTVRNHLSAIYRKVGVHSQSELLAQLFGRGAQAVTDA